MTEGVIGRDLYDRIIAIQPLTMKSIIGEIMALLKKHPQSDKFYVRLWKALFFGLWNYDKMINQHYLCEQIASIVQQLPSSKAMAFVKQGFIRLEKYWERVDHHRINKYMKLLRYLLRQALRHLPIQTIQQLLKLHILYDLSKFSGISQQVMAIYIDVLEQADQTPTINTTQWLFNLLMESSNKEYRQYIVENVIEKMKTKLKTQEVEQLKQITIEKAKQMENQQIRKSLFDVYGFLRSQQTNFKVYMTKKKQNKERESINRVRKRLTKGKIRERDRLKEKRKKIKPKKILSKKAIEMI